MNAVTQTVGRRLNIRVDEIRAQALKLQPMDGRAFNPPVLDRAEVHRELIAAARKAGFKNLTAPLAPDQLWHLDIVADAAEEALYKRSFGDDALPGQRMKSHNPWETALCGPAHTTEGTQSWRGIV